MLLDYDGQIIRRKNGYLACQMHARLEEMTPAEEAKAMREAYWADYVTEAEWTAMLALDDGGKVSRSTKSRLKKKGAGWLVCLAHLAENWPELFDAMVEQARTMHAEQMGRDFPWGEMVPQLTGRRRWEDGQRCAVSVLDPGYITIKVEREWWEQVVAEAQANADEDDADVA